MRACEAGEGDLRVWVLIRARNLVGLCERVLQVSTCVWCIVFSIADTAT